MRFVKSINRDNLRIARLNIGLSTDMATKKISTSKVDLVAMWESGESLPTWSQTAKLAKIYNISELILFSNQKLEKIKAIPDYRVGLSNKEDDEQLKKLINLVITRQAWLENKFKSEGFPVNLIQGSGKNINKPKKLANFIKEKLEINTEDIKRFYGKGSRIKTLDYLIEKAESKNIFVGKTIAHIKIKVGLMRGIYISSDYCPFIIINRDDAQAAQIFSFAHELAHLFRKTEAISNVDFRNQSNNLDKEEAFCNQVASELLLPSEEFTKLYYDIDDVRHIAEEYNVSQLFVFYRLKGLNKIPREIQNEIEKQIIFESKQGLIEKGKIKKKGGNYTNSMKDSNGNLFNRLVSGLYFSNQINYVEASRLLRFSVENHA